MNSHDYVMSLVLVKQKQSLSFLSLLRPIIFKEVVRFLKIVDCMIKQLQNT